MRPMALRTERDAVPTDFDFVEMKDAVYKWYCLSRQTSMPATTSTKRSFAEGIQIPNLKHQMAGLIVLY